MKRFLLVRSEDISGVSGTGVVAEGVEFHDGQCVLSWLGRFHTIEVVPTIEAVVPPIEAIETIHGHEGRTRIQWLDTDEPVA